VAELRVRNDELKSVRQAARELGRLIETLDAGEQEKLVLTQRNQMRAVLLSVDRYAEIERCLASLNGSAPSLGLVA